MTRIKSLAAAAALLAMGGIAQAALVKNGDGTVTDTTTQLIWLQNWDVNGRQNWATQKAWANNLNFAGSSDWALPSITDYTTLFDEFGDLAALGVFTNVQQDAYWSGTELLPGQLAWAFFPAFGLKGVDLVVSRHLAVAVRPAAVATPVPEPQTLALALLALGAAAAARRMRALETS